MIRCPNCQREVDDDSRFCSFCGEHFQTCSYCGGVNTSRANYCINCGAKLEKRIDEDVIQQGAQSNGYQHDDNIYNDNYQQQHTSFNDHYDPDDMTARESQPKRIYWRIVIAAVLALALITGASYWYLATSSPIDYVDDRENSSNNNNNNGGNNGSVNQGDVNTYDKSVLTATKTTQIEKFSNLCLNGQIDSDGQAIYMLDDSGRIVRLSMNFSDGKALTNEKCTYINVVDGKIYYCDSNYAIHVMNNDGSNDQTLVSTASYYVTYYNGSLYYQNDPDGESLYVYDLSSRQSTKLINRHMYNMSIDNDTIYYSAKDGIYAYNIKTRQDQKLVENQSYCVTYLDGYVYYITTSGTFCRYGVNDRSEEVIINDGSVAASLFSEKAIYLYRRSYTSSLITRIDLATKTTTTVFEGVLSNTSDMQVIGDQLVVKSNGHYQMIDTSNGKYAQIFK